MRILSWNIERFGVNKLRQSWWDTVAARGTHIERLLQEAQPDVLVVQEVQTSPAEGFGGLVSDPSGGNGVRDLRALLEQVFPMDEWGLVPPAILTPQGGYSEGIAVFFKTAVLQFEGPMVWTANGIRAPGGGAIPVAYGPPWANVLPEAPSNLGPNQNRLAGQFAFRKANGTRWNFPDGNSRSLWHTLFFNPHTNRHLSLISLHFPPAPADARRAFANLVRVTEVRAPLQPEEDRVILGDFNINVNAPNQRDAFQHLTNGAVAIPGVPICPRTYTLQFPVGSVTTVRQVMQASPRGVPPYYRYAKLGLPGLDNAFVIRDGAVAAANNQDVINPIVGVPLGAPGRFAIDMAEDIPTINAALPPGAPRTQRFNTLVNYGHIGGRRGASDHLGIVFDLP